MRIRFLWVLSVVSAVSGAAERHYPVVGPDGRLQVITSPSTDDAMDKKPAAKAQTAPAESPKPAAPAATEIPDKVQEGGESWLTTEQLERKGFKPEGKNRFYYLPDGSMGKAPLESEAGIPVIAAPRPDETVIVQAVRPSPNYRIFDKRALEALIGFVPECLSPRQLRRAIPVLQAARFAVEPPVSLNDRSPDKVFSLADVKADSAIRMVSYSLRADMPGYYLPVAVWLGADGCVLSAAWNYWVNELPGSEFRYSGIENVLLVPAQAAYLSFYGRPADKNLPFRLEQQGSLSLELFE